MGVNENEAPAPEPAEKPRWSFDAAGRHVAEDGTRDLMVWIDGKRYEHVSETKDGKWIYAAS